MDDTGHQKDEGKTSGDAEHDEPLAGDEKDKAEEVAGDKTDINDAESKPKSVADLSENKLGTVKTEKKDLSGKEAVIDKEVLEAFRFFDRNGAGYIRVRLKFLILLIVVVVVFGRVEDQVLPDQVEDMRLIIHSLGKFLSHRDVKELVQSALLESNTGRDDRILYNKLVIMTGV
uniref:EF-hand domain-containing protein n=1 Tax=Salix viminalis TaxID=40686 RepID=A0A6N2NCB1_SALVM